MSTIELGEVNSAPSHEPTAVAVDHRLVRRLGLAVAAALCLLTGAGSTLPEPRVRPLWSVDFDDSSNSLLGTDAAYLFHRTDSGYRLDAHDLVTGALRWRNEFDGAGGYGRLAEADGLLLLPAGMQTVDSGTGSDDSEFMEIVRATIAVDVTTGRQLWRLPGDTESVNDGTALMSDYDDRGKVVRLRLVRLSDQRTMWSIDTPGLHTYSVTLTGGRPDKLVTTLRDGRVEVLRYADGARVTRGRIAWYPQKPEEGQFIDVTEAGGYLVAQRHRNDRVDLSVYHLATLTEAWRVPNAGGFANVCGPALCLHDERAVAAYDLATGVRRWQVTGFDNAWSVTDDRLLAEEDGTSVLFDTATGRRVGEPVPGTTAWNFEARDTLYLLRPTVSPPDNTAIIRWDLATGRTDLLGATDELSDGRCQISGRYLGCTADLTFQVVAIG